MICCQICPFKWHPRILEKKKIRKEVLAYYMKGDTFSSLNNHKLNLKVGYGQDLFLKQLFVAQYLIILIKKETIQS